jgi:hypothetical protein
MVLELAMRKTLAIKTKTRLRSFVVSTPHFSTEDCLPLDLHSPVTSIAGTSSDHLKLKNYKFLNQIPKISDGGGGAERVSEPSTRDRKSNAPRSHQPKPTQIEIDAIFGDRHLDTMNRRFDSFIAEKLSKCSIPDIARFIRLSGNKMNRRLSKRLRQHLPAIALQLHSMSDVPWKMMHISFVIYGLQCFQETDKGYLNILATMSKLATKTLDKDEKARLDPRDISMLLQGLQNNRCEEKESRELVLCIARMLRSIPESFEAQGIGNALYGLQNMNSDSVEVLSLIAALTPKVEGCQKPLSALDIGLALYGLRGR